MPARKPDHTRKKPSAAKGRKNLKVIVRGEQRSDMSARSMAEIVMMLARQLRQEAEDQADKEGKTKQD